METSKPNNKIKEQLNIFSFVYVGTPKIGMRRIAAPKKIKRIKTLKICLQAISNRSVNPSKTH